MLQRFSYATHRPRLLVPAAAIRTAVDGSARRRPRRTPSLRAPPPHCSAQAFRRKVIENGTLLHSGFVWGRVPVSGITISGARPPPLITEQPWIWVKAARTALTNRQPEQQPRAGGESAGLPIASSVFTVENLTRPDGQVHFPLKHFTCRSPSPSTYRP